MDDGRSDLTHYTVLTVLICNAALLIALSALYSLLARFRKNGELLFKVLSGLLFGCAAIAGMELSFRISHGIFYDGRTIVLVMAGLFGGGTAAVVSAVSQALTGPWRVVRGCGPDWWS